MAGILRPSFVRSGQSAASARHPSIPGRRLTPVARTVGGLVSCGQQPRTEPQPMLTLFAILIVVLPVIALAAYVFDTVQLADRAAEFGAIEASGRPSLA